LETVTGQLHYDNDRAHGDWAWTNNRGEVLQTARFEQGKLVHWNGRPVQDELVRWRQAQRIDSRLVQWSMPHPITLRLNRLSVEEWFNLGSATRVLPTNQGVLVLHSPAPDPSEFLDLLVVRHPPDQPIGAGIVEGALLSSRIIVGRFDLLCVVPICSRELDWVDCTGVMQVQFTPGTIQPAYWSELRAPEISRHSPGNRGPIQSELQQLFRETGIEVDHSQVVEDPAYPHASELPTDKRVRRDILGVMLAGRDWSCEQHGNTLVLLPYPQSELVARNDKPSK
jgi:hypothetical protein